MKEYENVELIKEHFAAFGRGDLQSALNIVAEKVDWQSPVTCALPKEITWATPRNSRKEVMLFFLELADKVHPDKFEIIAIIAQDDKVVVEGRNQGMVKLTGNSYKHDWIMVFTLTDGKIVRHRHYYDTEDVASAFR